MAKPIEEGKKKLSQIMKKWGYLETDEYVLTILEALKSMYYIEIHKNLVYEETEDAEKEIRRHVKDIVLSIFPCFDAKFGMIEQMRRKTRKNNMRQIDIEKKKKIDELTARYMSLYDDFYAMVSFRSLEHFALYMEWDTPEKDKVWKYNLNCFHGYWYYVNQAILDKKWQRIMKQCPTGYGKTYSDIVVQAFIFGYDINADILKVVGNPRLVGEMTQKLVKYMCSKRYAKVFPYFSRFDGNPSAMFDVCQLGSNQQSGNLLIHGSKRGSSLLLINKESSCDGVRAMYRFYDDITKSKDKLNSDAHDKDKASYNDQWKKRKYDDGKNFEFFSGTTYNVDDFLSYIKRTYGGDGASQSPINQYTKTNEATKTVFVSVPKLDPKTDECTFPHKYSTEEARADRDKDYNTFMAMDQQEPVPLEGLLFSWDYLNTYESIPHEDKNECCWAVIDPARKGKNYVSMPIFLKIDNKHYLKDCVYELAIMDNVIPIIIDKIIRHHITRIQVEINTDTGIQKRLTEELAKVGVMYCNIEELYTYKRKEEKILNNCATIRNYMVFPDRTLYAESSSMGQFMKGVTTYNGKVKVKFDDAPDTLAMYSEAFIVGGNNIAEIQMINIRKPRKNGMF